MKTFVRAAALAVASLSIVASSPAFAQASSYTPGSYWDVSGIKLEPGQAENYLDFVATEWKKLQEFGKSKGWVEDYMVLANTYPRDGEPDLYLMIKYKSTPDAAEQLRREKAYDAFSKTDAHQADTQSGARVKMRTIKEQIQFQQLMLK